MIPFRSAVASLTAALSLAAATAFAGSSPLAVWMRSNMAIARTNEDYAALKSGFDLVGGKAPSAGYGQWATIAKSGSGAAAKKDIAAVKAACDRCHDAYKKKYRKEFRNRPFP